MKSQQGHPFASRPSCPQASRTAPSADNDGCNCNAGQAAAAEQAFQRHYALRCLPWDLLHALLWLLTGLLHLNLLVDEPAACSSGPVAAGAWFKGSLVPQWLPLRQQQAAEGDCAEASRPAYCAATQHMQQASCRSLQALMQSLQRALPGEALSVCAWLQP